MYLSSLERCREDGDCAVDVSSRKSHSSFSSHPLKVLPSVRHNVALLILVCPALHSCVRSILQKQLTWLEVCSLPPSTEIPLLPPFSP